MVDEIIHEQEEAGLDFVTDGQVSWADPVSHLLAPLDGVRTDGLLRFLDTNFYFRQPVIEARLSHLAYAPEIAEAMLRRQQAVAVVAARTQIVEGAVSMVELALEKLAQKQIVKLDDERKAAMVSNLLVVLCSESSATPVVNAGTLYQ